MSRYEQLSMFTMNVEQVTATCCMDDARGTHELGDDDSLGAADDEGTVRGLQREIAHEHGLGLDFAGVAVFE